MDRPFRIGRRRYWRGWTSRPYPARATPTLYLVTWGAGRYLSPAGSVPVEAGSLLVCAADIEHRWETDHPEGVEYDFLVPRAWDRQRVATLLGGKPARVLRLPPGVRRGIRDALHRLEMEQARGGGAPEIAGPLLEAVWSLAERAAVLEGPGPGIPLAENLHRAQAFIRGHARENPGIGEIATAAGLSPRRLRALFRQETGRGPKDWLLDWKLERAKELLRVPDLPLKALAEQLGFSSAPAFAAFFRARMGVPPGQWRKGDRPTR